MKNEVTVQPAESPECEIRPPDVELRHPRSLADRIDGGPKGPR